MYRIIIANIQKIKSMAKEKKKKKKELVASMDAASSDQHSSLVSQGVLCGL